MLAVPGAALTDMSTGGALGHVARGHRLLVGPGPHEGVGVLVADEPPPAPG